MIFPHQVIKYLKHIFLKVIFARYHSVFHTSLYITETMFRVCNVTFIKNDRDGWRKISESSIRSKILLRESVYQPPLATRMYYAYLGVMDRDRGRVLERQASRVAVKRYRYDRCMRIVEVTESQFAAARREP